MSEVYYKNTSGTFTKISAADIGAAATSHTHNYLPLTGGTLTGQLVCAPTSTEANIRVKAASGQLQMYATTSSTGNKGFFAYAGTEGATGVAILNVSQGNHLLTQRLFTSYGNHTIHQNTNFTLGSPATSTTYGNSRDYYYDSAGVRMGDVLASLSPDDEACMTLEAVNASANVNALRIYMGTGSGDYRYTVSSPAAFRTAIGVVRVTSGTGNAPANGTSGDVYIKVSA